jgi:hypothetical protein
MKYFPRWPSAGFEDLDVTRTWVNEFVALYNNEHCHSQIKFVAPAQRHNGEDKLILKNWEATYQAAKAKNPNRWSGQTKNWDHIEAVELNPQKPQSGSSENRSINIEKRVSTTLKNAGVLGFALFFTLTPVFSRIRFAFAMYTLLLMASFRPHR